MVLVAFLEQFKASTSKPPKQRTIFAIKLGNFSLRGIKQDKNYFNDIKGPQNVLSSVL